MRLFVAGLLVLGCGRDSPQPQSGETQSQARRAAFELNLDAEDRPVASQDAGLDSAAATQRLAEVQAVADSARTEAVAAPALLRAGLLKLRLYPADIGGEIASRRPQDFFHNEIAGGWLYTGADFDTLLARYPRSALADDARFAKLFLIPGGECEGRVDCYIGFGLAPHFGFLESDPASPHALSVVRIVNARIRTALAGVQDLQKTTELYDREATRASIVKYQTIARALPSPARDSAAQLADSVLAGMGAVGRP